MEKNLLSGQNNLVLTRISHVQHWEIAVRYLIIKMDYESNKTPLLFFSVKKKISILLGLYNAHNRVMSPVLDPEAQAWL